MRFWLPVLSLWWREMIRFLRQRSRVVGSLAQPLLFWLLLGSGFRASFQLPGAPKGIAYAEYFYPGVVCLVLLFTAIFATISTVQDRNEGFLQGALVAPVPRSAIVLGQALGGTTLALLQGLLLLILSPLAGFHLGFFSLILSLTLMAALSFGMTSLGLVVAWRMDSVQGFHAIMNLFLMPLWLLSGAVFPAGGAPIWLAWIMRVNPVTYGVAAVRRSMYWGAQSPPGVQLLDGLPPMGLSVTITLAFSLVIFLAAVWVAGGRRV